MQMRAHAHERGNSNTKAVSLFGPLCSVQHLRSLRRHRRRSNRRPAQKRCWSGEQWPCHVHRAMTHHVPRDLPWRYRPQRTCWWRHQNHVQVTTSQAPRLTACLRVFSSSQICSVVVGGRAGKAAAPPSKFWAVRKLSENLRLKMQHSGLKKSFFGKYGNKLKFWTPTSRTRQTREWEQLTAMACRSVYRYTFFCQLNHTFSIAKSSVPDGPILHL